MVRSKTDYNVFSWLKRIVEKGKGHFCITSSSSHFFNKTNFEQYGLSVRIRFYKLLTIECFKKLVFTDLTICCFRTRVEVIWKKHMDYSQKLRCSSSFLHISNKNTGKNVTRNNGTCFVVVEYMYSSSRCCLLDLSYCSFRGQVKIVFKSL